ncbi:kinase-like domain-containing protein [Mucidula mucida]|nr:kinase-like domain-containing protein [Mucidula mucida]
MQSDSMDVFDEARLHDYTDEQLLLFIGNSPCFAIDENFSSQTRILSHSFVAKHSYRYRNRYPADEIEGMKLATRIGVRVPKLHRVVPAENDQGAYLIMTRIHGRVLADIWISLGWWRTIRLALQLSRFVKLMHSVTSLTGGSLSTGAALCTAFDEDKSGPVLHASPTVFAEYINWWVLFSRPPRFIARPEHAIGAEKHHVFCHTDLSPHNMIMDNAHLLWLIDWQDSGFYPSYMEHNGMRLNMSLENSWWGDLAFWRWRLFRWLVTGSHPKEENARSRQSSPAIPAHRAQGERLCTEYAD